MTDGVPDPSVENPHVAVRNPARGRGSGRLFVVIFEHDTRGGRLFDVALLRRSSSCQRAAW